MMGNHALDGLIARAASLFGLCLLLCPLVIGWLGSHEAGAGRRGRAFAFALGFAGALIQLNAYVLSMSDLSYAEPSVWRPELAEFGHWLGPALRETQFGRWWSLHVVTLIAGAGLAIRRTQHPAATGFVATLWVLSLVRLGHAAGYPVVSAAFISQFIHTSAVVGWFSALLGLTTLVLEESSPPTPARLRQFGRAMLGAMLLIVLTGTIRLSGVITHAVADWRTSLYLWIVGAKLGLVLAVLAAAAVARRRLLGVARETLPPATLRQCLSLEVLAASLVLFVSTLLSQASPP